MKIKSCNNSHVLVFLQRLGALNIQYEDQLRTSLYTKFMVHFVIAKITKSLMMKLSLAFWQKG